MKIFLFSFSFLLASVNLSYAKGTIQLEPIVVTPYRAEVAAGISPAATKVISMEEAEREGKFTFTDAVKNIPSLSHATTGGLGGDTAVFIRGANSAHTQVMLDGIKLYDPISTSGYFYAYNYMALDNIDKVEVAKGPYSALYGSGSIGGTINLIPRRGKGDPSFSYFQEGGSYNTLRGIFSAQGEIENLSYALSTSWSNIRRFYALRKDDHPEKDPYRDINSSLNLNYQITDSVELGLLTDYTYSKYYYDGDTGFPDYLPADADNCARFYQGIGGVSIDHQISDLFFHKVIVGHTRTRRKDYNQSWGDSWFDGNTYQVKWQADLEIIPENKIIFGFDYLREKGESVYVLRQTNNSKGYYIKNLFNPWDNLLFSASYRREEHSQFGGENLVSFSGAYFVKETGTKLKSSFGQGFKAPSLSELYGFAGNPNLVSERSRSFEAGVEQNIGERLTLGITYFQNKIKNLIEQPDPMAWWEPLENVAKAKIYGVESFFELDITDDTIFKVGYTHLDATKRPEGNRLLRRPNNKVTCSLSTQWDRLSVYSELSYVGNRIDSGDIKLKSYLLANMNLNYQVNENLEFSLRLENVLNRDYELVKGYQTPKFSWYAGTKIKF